MRDLLEQLLRAVSESDPVRAESLWADYRDRSDEAAFATLLAWYGLPIYRRAWGFLREHAAAEDAFQVAIGKLHAHRARLASFTDAMRWWRGVVLNEARMILRARCRSRARETTAAVPESAATADRAGSEALREAMDHLPAELREAVALVYFEGMTRQEAAKLLDIHRDTLAKRLEQALRRLRNALGTAGVLGTVGTTATVEAALTNAVPGPSMARLAGLATMGVKNGLIAPPTSGATWVTKAVVLFGLVAAGCLTWTAWPHPKPPEPATNAEKPPEAPPETLQAKNLRIARDEIAGQVRDIFQRFYPNEYVVRVESVHAFGSEVEIVLRVTPPPPAVTGLAAVTRGRYCVFRRQLTVSSQPTGESRWYSMNPERPVVLTIPNPLGAPVTRVIGREEFAAAARVFDQHLPKDDRSEKELLRLLFGPPGGELLLPTETRGVSGFPGGIIVVAGNSAMYVRDGNGLWRYAGECPGWWPVVAAGQVYCYADSVVWSRPLDKPAAPWEKWCVEPTQAPGERAHGPMFIADGRLCMTMDPHGLCSKPLADPTAEWTRTVHRVHHNGVAAIGSTLFGNDGKQLFKRPAGQLDAAWIPVGPWPLGYDRLIADGDRLLAYGWDPGPIYARPLTAGPVEEWTLVGRIHDPYKH